MPSFTSTVISLAAGATLASAHGFVKSLIINGESVQGYDVTNFPYQASPPDVIAWSQTATDLGFVDPTGYSSGDIVCHRGAENAALSATVKAGDSISFVWNTWPEGHKGPVIDYLAKCSNGDCTTVDKTTLEFFKIQEKGLIESSNPGVWASDELISNGLTWTTTIPDGIAPGSYVLRHEIIALHSAFDLNAAQNYPQCINLIIEGTGTLAPAGVLATDLYDAADAGIHFNLYESFDSYPIPGPALSLTSGGSGEDEGTTDPEPTTTAAPDVPAPTATQVATTTNVAAVPTTTVAAPTTTATTAPAETTAPPTETVSPCITPKHKRRGDRKKRHSKKHGKKHSLKL